MRAPSLFPLALMVLSSILLPGAESALGQDADDPESNSPQTESAETSPATEVEPAEADLERLIYVPYRELKDVFEQHGATAFLPYLEYLKLWQSQSQPQQAGPQVDAVITDAHFTARADGNLARIHAKFVVQVLGKPWVKVPIQFGDAAVGKLTSEHEQVLLQATGPGTYALLFGEAGRHTVELELSTRIRTSPDGNSLTLTIPTVGITTFELVVPEEDQTVTLSPDVVAIQADAAAGETRVKASLGAVDSISAMWHAKAGTKPEMDLLTAVDNRLLVSIQDGLIHTDAYLHYEILRGELQQLEIAVPTGHRILGVSSNDARIKGWKVSADADRQVITVELLTPATGNFVLEVHTEREQPADIIDVAGISEEAGVLGIHSLDAIRESGHLVVATGSDLTLSVEDQQGLIRVEEEQVPQEIRRASALSYRFYSPQFTLQVSVQPVEPRITVEQQIQLVIRDDELKLTSHYQFLVERAGVFEIRIAIPEGLTIDNVSGPAVKEYNVDAATNQLRIALTEKQTGQIAISLHGHQDFDAQAAESRFLLPLPEPLNVVRETATVKLYAPPAIEVISDEEQLIAAQPEPAGKVANVPNARFAAAWSFNRRPAQIGVRTVRRPTRLTARVHTSVDVKQTGAEVNSLVHYQVEYAGLDTFRLSVPEAVADTVQIEKPGAGSNGIGIKQKSRATEAVDGWVVWTVIMQRPVEGALTLKVTYDLEPAPLDPATNDAGNDASAAGDTSADGISAEAPSLGEEQRYSLQVVQALGLEASGNRPAVALASINGEIAVQKDRALSVSADVEGETLETIDVRELTSGQTSAYLAYRYFTQPVELTIVAVKHEIQEVVETVISKSLVEIVLSKDDRAAYRARYVLKSSERQRLRIDWSQQAELLGLFVDKKPVNPERHETAEPAEGYDAFYVNVARTKSSDEPFSITLLFTLPLGEVFDARGGRLELPLPVIGGTGERTVAVQELRTAIWIPEEYALVGTPENFVRMREYSLPQIMRRLFYESPTRTHTENVESWIGSNAAGLFDFPTQGDRYIYRNLGGAFQIQVDWLDRWFWTVVLSGAFLIVGWVLRRTPWENKLSVLLLLAFAASLAAIRYDDWVLQALLAARWGLLALAVLWVIFAVANLPVSRASIPAGATTAGTVPAVTPPPESSQTDNPEKRETKD